MTQVIGLGLTLLTLAAVAVASTLENTLHPCVAAALVLLPQLAAISVFLSKPS